MKVKVGEITKIKTGKLDANASSENGEYPFFTCSKEPLKIDTYSYDCECVLVAGNGELNVKYYNGKFDAYQRTYIIEDNSNGLLYMPYLYYFFEKYVEELRKQSIGGIIKYIKLANLTDALIELPSIEEQKFIVSLLDSPSKLISLRKDTIKKLDLLIKARFIEMFGDPDKNPYNWNITTINDVCSSIVRGPFGSALKKEFFVPKSDTTVKVYEQQHAIKKNDKLGTYYITEEKYESLKRFECKPGDILMSCSGTMGKLYQLPEGCEKGIINQALCKFTLNGKMLPIVFLESMKYVVEQMDKKGSGIQNIAAVNYVKAMKMCLPPKDVQESFTEFYKQVDKSKLAVQKGLQELEILKKSLMQQYFG